MGQCVRVAKAWQACVRVGADTEVPPVSPPPSQSRQPNVVLLPPWFLPSCLLPENRMV